MVFLGATAVEHERVALSIAAGALVRVHVTVRRYACPPFGDVGPLEVDHELRPRPVLGADGRIRAQAGPVNERVTVSLRRHGATLTGTLRVSGTIATGEPCASRTLRFSARASGGGRGR